MRSAYLFFLSLISASFTLYTDPVNGISGQLEVVNSNTPFHEVYVNFTNHNDFANSIKIPYSSAKFFFKVTDKNGKQIEQALGPWDGPVPTPEDLILPHKGTIRFQISFSGLAYNPDSNSNIIDLGPPFCWEVPSSGNYFLSGSFICERVKGSHPKLNWSGNLSFPPTPCP